MFYFVLHLLIIKQGEKIKSELAALVQDLPNVYDDVAESSVKLKKAISFYEDFCAFMNR